jgi:predicted RNase H-like HicB family nuclease
LKNQEGSHRRFVHPLQAGKVTVAGRRAAEDPQVDSETGGLKMSKYLVLFEKSSTGYGAYAPDLPGCIATGRTLQETRDRMTKAVEMHLSAMREDGDEIPQPSHFELVDVA